MFSNSRQAYYQFERRNYDKVVKTDIILQFIRTKRAIMPRLGGKKLYHLMKQELPVEVHMGRDEMFNLMRDNHLLIRQKRTQVRTTHSNHWLHKYPNLIRDFTPNRANQLWVSDITYIRVNQDFKYLFLITDAYSRKIVGWELADTLEARHAVSALRQAIRKNPNDLSDLIHHSDRGIQYCSSVYVKLLQKYGIDISMTENGDPLENAIAERINGILKQEWLNDLKMSSLRQVKSQIAQVIDIYNNFRPHTSVNNMTPSEAHAHTGELKRLWKNYYKTNRNEGEELGEFHFPIASFRSAPLLNGEMKKEMKKE